MTPLITTTVLADYDGYGHMAGWDGWGWMWVTGLVVMVGAVVAVVLAMTAAGRRNDGGHAESEPRDILARRYARGEISTDEYHERLEGLR